MNSKNGLIKFTEGSFEVAPCNPQEAWQNGVSTALAKKHEPERLRMYLYAQIKVCSDLLDYKKRLSTNEEYFIVADTLAETFPVMKVEEWQHVFKGIMNGTLVECFERLKLPEIMEAARNYEGKRAEWVENTHKVAIDYSYLDKLRLSEAPLESYEKQGIGTIMKKKYAK